jgi:predicted small lipoprotein YifL
MRLALALCLALVSLAACGLKGDPAPPPTAEDQLGR